jgi:hypothetical protein
MELIDRQLELPRRSNTRIVSCNLNTLAVNEP